MVSSLDLAPLLNLPSVFFSRQETLRLSFSSSSFFPVLFASQILKTLKHDSIPKAVCSKPHCLLT
jgi:hypothetical protein